MFQVDEMLLAFVVVFDNFWDDQNTRSDLLPVIPRNARLVHMGCSRCFQDASKHYNTYTCPTRKVNVFVFFMLQFFKSISIRLP